MPVCPLMSTSEKLINCIEGDCAFWYEETMTHQWDPVVYWEKESVILRGCSIPRIAKVIKKEDTL